MQISELIEGLATFGAVVFVSMAPYFLVGLALQGLLGLMKER